MFARLLAKLKKQKPTRRQRLLVPNSIPNPILPVTLPCSTCNPNPTRNPTLPHEPGNLCCKIDKSRCQLVGFCQSQSLLQPPFASAAKSFVLPNATVSSWRARSPCLMHCQQFTIHPSLHCIHPLDSYNHSGCFRSGHMIDECHVMMRCP